MGLPSDGCLFGASVSAGVAERLPLLIVQAGMELVARSEQGLTELGLDGGGYTALAVLHADKPASQRELAQRMGKAPAILVGIVDELEQRGFVERVRAPEDRRRVVVQVTAAGQRALEQGDALAAAIMSDLFGELPDDDVGAMHDTLRRALGAPVHQ